MWTGDVAEGLEESGAEILIVPNGSPFEHDKQDVRLNLAVARVTETGLPLIYCNQVGGQDELVFDGASFVLNADRRLVAQAKGFEEDLLITRWRRGERRRLDLRRGAHRAGGRGAGSDLPGDVPGLARLRRQEPLPGRGAGPVRRHRFGAVRGRRGRRARARAGARRDDAVPLHFDEQPRGCRGGRRRRSAFASIRIPIEPAVGAFAAMLEPIFAGRSPDITEENLQARIRGVILMALSNKLGSMVLTTGNKSEMSVGYATLYGDMCGGYSVLKDVYKTTVFALARWRNQHLPTARARPGGRRHPRARHRQAAVGRAAREPDRSGQPAALRRAGRDPPGPGRAGPVGARAGRARATIRRWCAASPTCSTSPSTSAARRRPGSRSRARRSAATAAIRSPTRSASSACPGPDVAGSHIRRSPRAWYRMRPATEAGLDRAMERRLAAILAADVVGYSRLMGQNEAGTLAAPRTRHLSGPGVGAGAPQCRCP